MSDTFFRWIPVDPSFVPRELDARRAVVWLRGRAPNADVVATRVTSAICFIDCGENLEAIHCHRCGAEITMAWWGEAMGQAAATEFETAK